MSGEDELPGHGRRVGSHHSAIVLAGGRSRRMGRDKALLPVGEVTLLTRTVATVRTICPEVVVVGRETLPSECPPVPVVPDEIPAIGPLGGLHTGMRRVSGRSVVCVACDLPHLRADVLWFLLSLLPGYGAVVPRVGGRSQPLHAVYARTTLPAIEAVVTSGAHAMEHLLARLHVRWVEEDELREIDPILASVQGANTPDEWEQLTTES